MTVPHGHFVRGAYRTNLTDRELQVLTLTAQGMNNIEIGQRLYLTVDTVKTHMLRIRRVLAARDRTHAVAIALTRGLITLDPPTEGAA